ncbi:MAG: extradiol dioxygenase [Gammaproteobacteria bacterium]|nr:extradiol dioxygenase [Gammaproteobacteria bacterium]|tara:strand:+ start:3618 stop:4013 length:396 start_codon:yes stop_codon:yes gene_type:complete
MQLAKESIDLGITTQNPAAALAFYRDTLGFEHVGEMKLDGITVQQLMCGTSMIKLVCHDEAPPAVAPPGGPAGATGLRYWTIAVNDLEEIAQRCVDSGCTFAMPVQEFRPGLKIAIVEDPDGNWVEFTQEG